MSQSVTGIFKDGQEYMKTWPMEKQLNGLFPEYRVISATKLSITIMPPLAVLSTFSIINFYGDSFIPQGIAIGAFFLSLPMQGLMWLGHRSNQTLPPALRAWYQEIHHKMQLQGVKVNQQRSQPRYKELAKLLKTAFKELDKVFTKQWF
ncbi:terminus macrodomain insulation protein YfbV [Aliiglaciecola sp. 3_MG-2023]|uniref:terminus macrodomain insulation protein YfbV n=1 Tax=Aliiglaciecola sp. 3_MG-2023 TaxID=3062644 RepID=UPI0026E36F04|nr:terminus macrodomain insulation protein YfbV [Aliiglaciecola sp. 3_MG-2023]MDO6693669.1 terminus macrodomain insulation protein YfbV [Aliiglaciecola sp. 3_MG-2023]